MIDQLINQIRQQQEGRETPLQALPIGPGTVDWSQSIPAHRDEGLTGLPTELPFTVSVDEYASSPGRGYVIRTRANVDGEDVEMTDQDGPLLWTQRSFRVEIRHKQFTGQWSGWGWRAEVIGNEDRDMGVRSLLMDHGGNQYTIGGAFTEQESETYPGLTVWAAEAPEGQRTETKGPIEWAALYASLTEVSGTLGTDDEVSVGRYWIGLEGNQSLPEEGTPEWETGVSYSVGDRVMYQGTEYECLQAHTSQAGWQPPNVPALWGAV